MIELVQLQVELVKLMATLKGARDFYKDPFYVAWLVLEVLDGQAPDEELLGSDFILVNAARKDQRFRVFWEQFSKVASAMELFGCIFTEDTRKKYQEQRRQSKEVPF